MATDPIIDKLDRLGAWELHEPSPGFADAVRGETTREEPERPSRWQRWALVGSLVAATAAGVGLVAWSEPPVVRGEIEATTRQSIELGERAVVVAEAEAGLAWEVNADGRALVRHADGAAFYRVDRGPAFVVETPAGAVEVTGTSFNVEVMAMDERRTKSRWSGVLAGAIGSAVVVVTVYEGGVVLANDEGSTAIEAGQTAVATDRSEPRHVSDPDGDDHEDELARLRAEATAQRREIASLRSRLSADGGGQPDATSVPSQEVSGSDERLFGPGSPVRPNGFAYFEPTQAALEEMARCGVVAWDQPDVRVGTAIRPETLEEAGVGEREAETVRAAESSFHEQNVAHMREFYTELGGAQDVANALTPGELLEFVYSRIDLEELVAARNAIAIEKAGQASAPPVDAQTVAGRFMRWEAQLGDAFEKHLARDLGADRAYELRAAGNGWKGTRMTFTNKCADE